MISACPRCGALLHPGGACNDRFTAAQLLELERPAYSAVQHRSVPCYMLQHDKYSRHGWISARGLVRRFVAGGMTPAIARQRGHRPAHGRRRARSYTRPRLPGVEAIAWGLTIADVRIGTAQNCCSDVGAWAEQILLDTEEVIRALGCPN
jgi:hypothetical protein